MTDIILCDKKMYIQAKNVQRGFGEKKMGQALQCRQTLCQKIIDERILNVISQFREFYDTDRFSRYL